MKYERRLVARDTFTDLEGAVLDLEEMGWHIDPDVPDEASGTLLGAFRQLRRKGVGVGIVIPMRRRIS